MLGGGQTRDEEDSQAPESTQNGQNDVKAELKAFMKDEIRKGFASIENKLLHHFENQHANNEDVKQKMGEMEKKVEELLQIEKRAEETRAANLGMMQCLARNAALLPSSEHKAPGCDARSTDAPSKTTGWLSSAKALIPWSPWMCAVGRQRERIGKTEMHCSQPPTSMSNITKGITTVTTVNEGRSPSNQVSVAVTMPTFVCQQPRTHPHSVSNLEMSTDFTRRSFEQSSVSQGQPVPSNISRDAILGLAKDMFRQTQSAENHQLRLVLEDYNGNHMTTAVAQVNKDGHQVAAKTRYVGDQTVLPYPGFDQSLSFQNLPLQITDGRRASYNGTNLTEKVILQLSKMFGHNWKTIGIECLGFKADYLSTIEAQHKDVHIQIFYMIRQWSRDNDADGTIEQLSQLLKESRDIDYDVLVYLDSLIKPTENTD